MARAHRRSPSDLNSPDQDNRIEGLPGTARAVSFFQAIRLLRRRIGSGGALTEAELNNRIYVRPNLSLAFPASDIESIEPLKEGDAETFRITANFLGLYGPSSPLPTFYTEDLLTERSQDESVSRDFMDLLNRRLFELMFQGWLKYRLFLQIAEEKNPAYLERLYCLLGLGSDELRRSEEDRRLLRYIGLFAQYPRSAAGLGTLLSDALQGIPVKIVPCISRQAAIPPSQRLRLGLSSNRLGTDSHMGQFIEDRMGKFRIQVGPLQLSTFLEFIPGRSRYQTLTELTEIYLTDPLEYEVEMILASGQAQTIRLGDPLRAVLGVTTWVFSKHELGEMRTLFTMHRN
jgi:type VI secretion system protein ImpH